MKRSVTIKLEDKIIRWAKHEAVNANKSFTAWVADILNELFIKRNSFKKVAKQAISTIHNARSGPGSRISRDSLYSDRVK